jgi:hypothetical protein
MLPIEDKCSGSLVEFLKFVSSLTTILAIGFMLWQMRVSTHLSATRASLALRHVYRQKRDAPSYRPDDPPPAAPRGPASLLGSACPGLRGASHLLYILINCVHTFPTFSRTVRMEMLSMTVTYRIEALIAVRASALGPRIYVGSTPRVPILVTSVNLQS